MDLRRIHLGDVPWMTLTLLGAIWGVYLFGLCSGKSEFIRESFGIRTGEYHTYLTHAFIHADLKHIVENSIALLIFGSVTEQQVKWHWFVAAISLGVSAGAIAGVLFPLPIGTNSLGPVVGISAVVFGLVIIGIGVLVRHWRWEKGVFWTTIVCFCLLLLAMASQMQSSELEPMKGLAAITFLAIGMRLSFYYWHRNSKLVCAFIPLMWVTLVLTGIVTAEDYYTSAAGHLFGAVVGAILLIPILRDEVPSQGSLRLRNEVRRVCIPLRRVGLRAWRAAVAVYSPAR